MIKNILYSIYAATYAGFRIHVASVVMPHISRIMEAYRSNNVMWVKDNSNNNAYSDQKDVSNV